MQVYQSVKSWFKKLGVNALEVDKDLVPLTNGNRDLGTNAKRWGNVYANSLHGDGSGLTNLPSGGGIANIVEDLTPELGGDLDIKSNDIKSTTSRVNLDGALGVRSQINGQTKFQVSSGLTTSYQPINPSGNGLHDLGAPTFAWKDIYATNFHGDGSNLTNLPSGGGLTLLTEEIATDDLLPSTADVINLGSDIKKFADIYSERHFNNEMYGNESGSNYVKLGGTGYVNLGGQSGWSLLAGGAINMLGSLTKLAFYKNVEPDSTNVRSLGTQSKRFSNIWGVNRLIRTQVSWSLGGTARTLNANENGYRISLLSNANTNVILPDLSGGDKTEVEFYVADANDYTFVTDGTSVVRSNKDQFTTDGQWAVIKAFNNGSAVWVISGALKL